MDDRPASVPLSRPVRGVRCRSLRRSRTGSCFGLGSIASRFAVCPIRLTFPGGRPETANRQLSGSLLWRPFGKWACRRPLRPVTHRRRMLPGNLESPRNASPSRREISDSEPLPLLSAATGRRNRMTVNDPPSEAMNTPAVRQPCTAFYTVFAACVRTASTQRKCSCRSTASYAQYVFGPPARTENISAVRYAAHGIPMR